jgi:7,8-dihydro-6-hydroxymethylpterin dimethyltransferase
VSFIDDLLSPLPGVIPFAAGQVKRDADYVFFELTRSICPTCRRPIDAQILLRHGKVYMRKRCPKHGQFEALVYADADAYVGNARSNKLGATVSTIRFSA